MPRAIPTFPAFDEWQHLSETEQDALLDRFEAEQRRTSVIRLALAGFAFVAVVAAGLAALVV
jgi:hypothetical protein